MNKFAPFIIVVLLIVVAYLGWTVWNGNQIPTTANATSTTPTSTPVVNEPEPDKPLSSRVNVTYPKKDQTVQRTFTVIGKAPGNWFFEASAPVQVRDKDGNKIAQSVAQVQGDWMTTELVDFTADISITNYSGPAVLVLLKDNPSGLPEHDDSLEIPIVIQ